MIKPDERRNVHEFILLDMAVKSLQNDYDKLGNLKMSVVYVKIVDDLLKDLRSDYFNKKRMLAKQKIEVVKWIHVDEYFSDVVLKTPGEDVILRYAKQALKSQVEKLLIEHLKSHSCEK
ncbi:aconitate hydratase [Lysinibacillus sp. CD3-6]|uniref:aconitate hydratase n=1 Tax=Lysinibacillus sp. CD3-6 TaxID=2892541 RepID=UPI0011666EE1|nr:aconitate hydratase [Lysinibacillus sp. CD3-6]UED81101.1 aconitate hydratase [Lysinibacillus sp. CD3-6]